MTQDTLFHLIGLAALAAGGVSLLLVLVRGIRGGLSGDRALADLTFAGSLVAFGIYFVVGYNLALVLSIVLIVAGTVAQRRLGAAEDGSTEPTP